jgi:hypothetical protein
MQDPTWTDVDTDEVAPVAAQFVALGVELLAAIDTAVASIEAIEAGRPQGGQQTGRTFDEKYADSGAARNAKDVAADLFERFVEFGQALGVSVELSEITDADNADTIRGTAG